MELIIDSLALETLFILVYYYYGRFKAWNGLFRNERFGERTFMKYLFVTFSEHWKLWYIFVRDQ